MPKRDSHEVPTGPDLMQDRPSRTKKKKAAEALQKTGEQLIYLNDTQLDQLNLPSELKAAVADARGMTRHGARRRQLQYIGTLMRTVDGPRIEQQLTDLTQQRSSEARRFKQVELWRDELKAGSDQRLTWMLEQFPGVDREELSRLVSEARQSHPDAARKAGRALFRFLRQLVEDPG